jgi:hypothetical protein
MEAVVKGLQLLHVKGLRLRGRDLTTLLLLLVLVRGARVRALSIIRLPL